MPMFRTAVLLPCALALVACGGGSGSLGSDNVDTPEQYVFDSVFVLGESSVVYREAVCHQTLIVALAGAVRDLQAIGGAAYRSDAIPYFDDTGGEIAQRDVAAILGLDAPVPAPAATIGALCEGRALADAFAGSAPAVEHRDWNTAFEGAAGYASARVFLEDLVARASEQAASGSGALDAPHYVSPGGIDYAQLIASFLQGAVAYSRGVDGHLGDDVSGSGLRAPFERSGEAPFAVLEHEWDLAFGYFGAARAYGDRSYAANRERAIDDNGDGVLDVVSELNFGAARSAATRDDRVALLAPTNFSGRAFSGFLLGRSILTAGASSVSELEQTRLSALFLARDTLVENWERTIAASVIHEINNLLAAMDAIGSDDFTIAALARAFSAMKGLALGLQFNPDSPVLAPLGTGSSTSRFQRLHALIGDAPPCDASQCVDERDYRDDLIEARGLLESVYAFNADAVLAW